MQTRAAGGCWRPSLWDSYNVAHAPISKTYAADAIPAMRARCGQSPRVEMRRVHARLSDASEVEHSMLDVIMLALGLGFFAASLGYAYACDRL